MAPVQPREPRSVACDLPQQRPQRVAVPVLHGGVGAQLERPPGLLEPPAEVRVGPGSRGLDKPLDGLERRPPDEQVGRHRHRQEWMASVQVLAQESPRADVARDQAGLVRRAQHLSRDRARTLSRRRVEVAVEEIRARPDVAVDEEQPVVRGRRGAEVARRVGRAHRAGVDDRDRVRRADAGDDPIGGVVRQQQLVARTAVERGQDRDGRARAVGPAEEGQHDAHRGPFGGHADSLGRLYDGLMRERTEPARPLLVAAARNLKADAVTAEVVTALRAHGLRSILLKGPTIERWLYGPDEARSYVDSDLLLSPSGFRAARPVLEGLGFMEHPENVDTPERGLPHAVPWTRPADDAQLDLHRNLTGPGVEPAEVWDALLLHSEPMEVGGTLVDVLDPPGRALMLALHARQHGAAVKPLTDLHRGLERLEDEVWAETVALADRLDATAALVIGLRLLPEGDALAERLRLPTSDFVERASLPGSRDRLAIGVSRLATTPGAGAKLGLLARELVPAPAFMRWWSPLARRGRVGLGLAYAYRVGWLARHLVPSVMLWRRARRPAPPA